MVIGGTGLVGAHVVRRLLARGCDVTVLHRGELEAEFPDSVRHVHADFNRLERGIECDVAIHLYALKQIDAANFVRVFRDCATRLIVASSGDVYRVYQVILGLAPGAIDPAPVTEDSPLRDVLYPYRSLKSEYAEFDKILVEREVMSGKSCVLRLPAVYGPGERQQRFGPWLKRMRAGADLPMSELQAGWRWTHGYVENAAEAIALAAVDARSSGRIYNVGERETPTMRERALRLGGRIVIVGDDELPDDLKQPGDLRQHLVMDSSRIRSELGYAEIVSEAEGLERSSADRNQAAEKVSAVSGGEQFSASVNGFYGF